MLKIDRLLFYGSLGNGKEEVLGVISIKSTTYCNSKIIIAILFMFRTILNLSFWNQKKQTENKYAKANTLDF
jgi:hypothetical protein